jgi:H+/Cl- antiporter ClcA
MTFSNYLRMGIRTHRDKLFIHGSFLLAAVCTGVGAAYFNEFIGAIQVWYYRFFDSHPYFMTGFTPLAFLAATAVVKAFAPHAGGSGVPQVLHASNLSSRSYRATVESGLVSIRTAAIRIVSTAIGLLGGASVGGEGPTVQIAGSIFGTLGAVAKQYFPRLDYHAYMVAAAGAGVGAAFNAPLGGVTFAIEEFAVGNFGPMRHPIILAVILAGLTSNGIIGNQLYFGGLKAAEIGSHFLLWSALIGLIGGLMGGFFGRIVVSPWIHNLKFNWWTRALLCGTIVAAIGLATHGQTAGSGYSVTRDLLMTGTAPLPLTFPLAKLLATAISTLSGIGGGILAPSLTIGGWMGVSVAKAAALINLKDCALIGMVAYFTGAFQLPLTAAVVVMEMTDRHDIIVPMLIAALSAHLVARVIMPEPLYHILIARSYEKKTLAD